MLVLSLSLFLSFSFTKSHSILHLISVDLSSRLPFKALPHELWQEASEEAKTSRKMADYAAELSLSLTLFVFFYSYVNGARYIKKSWWAAKVHVAASSLDSLAIRYELVLLSSLSLSLYAFFLFSIFGLACPNDRINHFAAQWYAKHRGVARKGDTLCK